MLAGYIRTEPIVQILGNHVPDVHVPGARRITVQVQRLHLVQKAAERILHFLGRGNRGVSEREVDNTIFSHFLFSLHTVIKEIPDDGSLSCHILIKL